MPPDTIERSTPALRDTTLLRHQCYVDGKWIVDHTTNVPTAPAYFRINHWGTNSTGWGGLATTGVTRYLYVTHASYSPLTSR